MNRTLVVIGAAILGAASPMINAQQKADAGAAVITAKEPGKATIAATARISATVEAIDLQERNVVLKGPRGNLLMLTVGPEVRNLERLKVGDLVVARYFEALTLTLKKDGKELRSRRETTGGTPANVGARQVEITADVTAVDAKTQTVTLRSPKRTVELKVRDPEQFKLVKVGDQVEALYTEAAAVSIEPATAPRANK